MVALEIFLWHMPLYAIFLIVTSISIMPSKNTLFRNLREPIFLWRSLQAHVSYNTLQKISTLSAPLSQAEIVELKLMVDSFSFAKVASSKHKGFKVGNCGSKLQVSARAQITSVSSLSALLSTNNQTCIKASSPDEFDIIRSQVWGIYAYAGVFQQRYGCLMLFSKRKPFSTPYVLGPC